MRRWAVLAIALLITSAGAACGGDSGSDDEDLDVGGAGTPSTSVAAATTVPGPTIPPTNLTLRIADVRLALNADDSDNGMRILLPPGTANANVTLNGLPSPNQVVSVCQVRELDRRLDAAACRTPANGEAFTLNLGAAASGIEVLQFAPLGTGPSANQAPLEEITIRYTAPSRELNVRLPQIASGDAGGRPTFSLTPASTDGKYQARLTWTVIQVFGGTPTSGQLELLQGGSVANQAQASADVRLNGTLATPGTEAAIRVQNNGGSALVTPKVSLQLP